MRGLLQKRKDAKQKHCATLHQKYKWNHNKKNSTAIVNSEHPIGRDNAKKIKFTDFIEDKVVESITKALAPTTPQAVDNTSFKTLQEDLLKANYIMQTMANHWVTAMVPTYIRE